MGSKLEKLVRNNEWSCWSANSWQIERLVSKIVILTYFNFSGIFNVNGHNYPSQPKMLFWVEWRNSRSQTRIQGGSTPSQIRTEQLSGSIIQFDRPSDQYQIIANDQQQNGKNDWKAGKRIEWSVFKKFCTWWPSYLFTSLSRWYCTVINRYFTF